ncbi:MAG TPA: fructosamine kinase family protein [Chitinophagaceae bacterium]|nr:fructosamine kinase family protein [Chitinophagaceae bacterium]
MLINQNFQLHLTTCFSNFFNEPVEVTHGESAPGGDISQTYILHTSKGKFFIKVNAALFGLDFFEKEARGLATLANAGTLKVPRPLFDGKFHQQIYVVMEYLEKGSPSEDFWSDFGRSIAAMHKHTREQYGLDYDNYIGKLHQLNENRPTWHEFYSSQRIMPLVYKAEKIKMLTAETVHHAEQMCAKLSTLIPEEKPALLHGDLWKGNFMVYQTGKAAIFDPSVFYGHREFDLAIARLFGGYEDSFYQAYDEVYPLTPGHMERVDIFQLYHLLVHLLLFGGHYKEDVKNILKKYS